MVSQLLLVCFGAVISLFHHEYRTLPFYRSCLSPGHLLNLISAVSGGSAFLHPVYPVNPVFDIPRSPEAPPGQRTKNPFSDGGAAPATSSQVDKEWDMFFADRAAVGPPKQ